MINYNQPERYLLEPEIIEAIDFEYLSEQNINEQLLHSLKNLKESNFARIIFMTKEEYKIVTVKIELFKIWNLIKKIKVNVI